jgi:uncharacterized protein YjdB
MDMLSPRLSFWIRSSLVVVIVAGCSSGATDAPTTSVITRISLVGPADSLRVGQSYQMRALDDAGRSLVPPSVAWTSSAPSVATVSMDGLVTARGLGVATIAATVGSLHGEFVLHVGTFTIVLKIAGAQDSLVIGSSYPLSAALFTSTGVFVGTPEVTWSSSNSAVVSVTSAGLLTAHSPGHATIIATDDTIAASVIVNVRDAQATFAILPDGEFGDTLQIAPGQTLQLTPFAYYNVPGWPIFPAAQVTWSSSNAGTATVSQSGVVTGVAPGAATITASILQHPVTRTIRVATTNGTTTIRMISAADAYSTVTMHPNVGTPATLAYGAVSEQVVPAGTLQLSFDGIPPLTGFYDPSIYGVQVFLGFLPAGGHETFIAVSNESFASYSGPAAIAWLEDRTEAVPADSSVVRVVLATSGGYNVFLTDPGAPPTLVTLRGCYLDWPFGYTAYTGRSPGNFDIVLLAGKLSPQGFGPEAARFRVTATAGHATTFILTGRDLSPNVFSVVDR